MVLKKSDLADIGPFLCCIVFFEWSLGFTEMEIKSVNWYFSAVTSYIQSKTSEVRVNTSITKDHSYK